MALADEARAEADRQQDEQWEGSLSSYKEAGYTAPVMPWEQMFWDAGYTRGTEVCIEWLQALLLSGTMHEYWKTAPIEELRQALAFQGGMTRVLLDEQEKWATPRKVEVTDEQVAEAGDVLRRHFEKDGYVGRWDLLARAVLGTVRGVQL